MTLICLDFGSPVMTSSVTLTVLVTDVNDNSPSFFSVQFKEGRPKDHGRSSMKNEEDRLDVEVPENLPLGTEIVRVQAVDPDDGDNGFVVHSIVHASYHAFDVSYAISESRNKSMEITPDMEKSEFQGHSELIFNTVPENHKEATPENGSSNLSLKFFENSGTTEFPLSIDPIIGSLFVCGSLDREKFDKLYLTIQAIDNGLPQRSTFLRVLIHIVDEDDIPPSFSSSTYLFTISENQPPGLLVGIVKAMDGDADEKHRGFSYKLSEGTTSAQRQSNCVDLELEKIKVDKETAPQNTDEVHPSVSNKRLLSLKKNSNSHPHVSQNSKEANKKLHASPDKKGKHLPSHSVSSLFKLNKTSGELSALKSLDRETIQVYCLVVAAVPDDRKSAHLIRVVRVVVNVTDVNDNKPHFRSSTPKGSLGLSVRHQHFPTNALKHTLIDSIIISTFTPVGQAIYKLDAYDEDFGKNASLVFSLTSDILMSNQSAAVVAAATTRPAKDQSHQQHQLFLVDDISGVVRLNRDISKVSREQHLLTFQVKDQGIPPLYDMGHLIVLLNNEILFIPDESPEESHLSKDNYDDEGESPHVLANENTVIVLSVTLAAILLAIAVVTIVIGMVKLEERKQRKAIMSSFNGSCTRNYNADDEGDEVEGESLAPKIAAEKLDLVEDQVRSSFLIC